MSGAEFSADEPLQSGVTVLEASAGTGKTYQISTLVVRLVAEKGISVDQILVMTFTRAATKELVDRVRRRLGEALKAARAETPAKDPALARLQHLQQSGAAPVAARLEAALQDFDQATITTIHGFCQRVLQQHAFESLADADVELMTDDGALRERVVFDALARLRYDAPGGLRAFLDLSPSKGGCGLDLEGISALTKVAVGQPDATLVPAESAGVLCGNAGAAHLDVPEDDAARAVLAGQVRADVARFARREMQAQTQRQRVQTYDDLLRLLADTLNPDAPDARRARLVDAVRDRYQVALIDEFQDTDQTQWTIFQALFGEASDRTLYLIGDPKQAIYGFRGANVHVYLDAIRGAKHTYTMGRNYRSDRRLVEALNHLWDHPGVFGQHDIEYNAVTAQYEADRLHPPQEWGHNDPRRAPLQLNFFDGGLQHKNDPTKLLSASAVGGLLTDRVAEDVVALLSSSFQIDDDEAPGGRRALHPGDVAILVRGHFQAEALQRALGVRGVPAVRSGAANVFQSEEAAALQRWLEAIVEPGRDGPARRAAVSALFGWRASDLVMLAEAQAGTVERWHSWLETLVEAAARFGRRGFMTAFRWCLDVCGTLPRLLGWPDGERRITNLMHLAELTHIAQQGERLGPAGTLSWLMAQRDQAGDGDAGEAELRLERDDAAVNVLTMHKSKGLQFPVVFAPYLWDGRRLRDTHPLVVPDPVCTAARLVIMDIDDEEVTRRDHLEAASLAAAEEAMRLAYVAMTRARHRCYVYGGPHTRSRKNQYAESAIGALWHGVDGDRLGGDVPHIDDPEALWHDLEIIASGRDDMSAVRCEPPGWTRWSPDQVGPDAPLSARAYTRGDFDAAWRVHSYSSLVHGLGALAVAPRPVENQGGGADDAPDQDAQQRAAIYATEGPLVGFPAGANPGTFLHAVLETVDFVPSADDASGERAMQRAIDEHARRFGFGVADTAGLASGLATCLRVPLGGPLNDFCLAKLKRGEGSGAPGDRLDELRFDMPLVPYGDKQTQGDTRIQGADFAAAFAMGGADVAEVGGLRAPYIEALATRVFDDMAGFLTGSIDLVFRHDGRWYIADYKSNRLDPERTGMSPIAHYERQGMWAEMEGHHYLIQGYLYALALHRFLRHRLVDYSYEAHFGGAVYLFLRGMAQPDLLYERTRPGVFHFRPDAEIIKRLDQLFAGVGVGEGAR